MEVNFTNGIPVCPHCQKPTIRTAGPSMTTCMYFPEVYNEKGENTNPDRNITTTSYKCHTCNKEYSISGNYQDGFKYVGLVEKAIL